MHITWRNFSTPQEYSSLINKMEQKVSEIVLGESPEEIWLLEHQPVYTAGTSAKEQDLIDTSKFPVFKTGRGGQYTYHGPGQRVMYPMLNLKNIFKPDAPDLRKFIFLLEQLIIDTLAEFGIKGERRKNRIGIWVQNAGTEEKIAAIGIRVKKWVSFHGIAINVKPELRNYSGITPCGISEFGVTSMEKLGVRIPLTELDNKLQYHFNKIFNNFGS